MKYTFEPNGPRSRKGVIREDGIVVALEVPVEKGPEYAARLNAGETTTDTVPLEDVARLLWNTSPIGTTCAWEDVHPDVRRDILERTREQLNTGR